MLRPGALEYHPPATTTAFPPQSKADVRERCKLEDRLKRLWDLCNELCLTCCWLNDWPYEVCPKRWDETSSGAELRSMYVEYACAVAFMKGVVEEAMVRVWVEQRSPGFDNNRHPRVGTWL